MEEKKNGGAISQNNEKRKEKFTNIRDKKHTHTETKKV